MEQADSILDRRRAGVLLHITSLPGGLHNGDLGADAYRFVDFLAAAGVTVWQTLPVNPTHGDGSPYQCLSAAAGNPLLINLEALVDEGWLSKEHLLLATGSPLECRLQCLREAYEGFSRSALKGSEGYLQFIEEAAAWLPDFALYMALKSEQGGRSWETWPRALRGREASALEAASFTLKSLRLSLSNMFSFNSGLSFATTPMRAVFSSLVIFLFSWRATVRMCGRVRRNSI